MRWPPLAKHDFPLKCESILLGSDEFEDSKDLLYAAGVLYAIMENLPDADHAPYDMDRVRASFDHVLMDFIFDHSEQDFECKGHIYYLRSATLQRGFGVSLPVATLLLANEGVELCQHHTKVAM